MTMLQTQRLDAVPATVTSVRYALEDVGQLGVVLGAVMPDGWPPELLEADDLARTLRWLEDPANDPAFGMYWVVLRETPNSGPEPGGRTLIGVVGFSGMPNNGAVQIGYGIVEEHQRRGYATEAVRLLLAHAFRSPTVHRVTADTYPHLTPSIGVLEKCGFRHIGIGAQPGVIRYGYERTA